MIANYGHQGSVMNWNGIQVFGNSVHPYCMDVMHGHSKSFQADFLLTLLDLQIMEPAALLGQKWVAWWPVDHQNIPPVILNNLKQADYRIAMSKHGQAEAAKHGIESDYIPCGVDLQVFKPYDMATSRTEMSLPTDKFIVGMVAMNKGVPSRKAFKQNIAAFAALQKKHKDCVLYLHTMDGTRGYEVENLVEFCNALGLSYGYAFGGNTEGRDVIFANQYGLAMGYEPLMMAKLFSSFDVLTAATMGEGFGIPILEAQACGTPVITGDWTSMPEITFSGWKVSKEDAEPMFTPLGAWQYLPRAVAIAERMEAAYQMRGNQDYRKRAKGGAQAYDADKITASKWLPLLDKIGGLLAEKPSSLDKNLDVLR